MSFKLIAVRNYSLTPYRYEKMARVGMTGNFFFFLSKAWGRRGSFLSCVQNGSLHKMTPTNLPMNA